MIKKIFYLILTIIISVGAYYLGFNNGRENEIYHKSSTISKQTKNLIVPKNTETLNNTSEAGNNKLTIQSSTDNSTDSNNKALKEYIVEENDTLFTIGLKFDVLWTHIAKANGIDENTPLFIGQKLKVPTEEPAGVNGQNEETQTFEINQTTAQDEQNQVNSDNTYSWRRDPVEVARREAPADFDLVPGDPYSLVASDLAKGTATVFLQKDQKSYTFTLIQPVDKGENGIWKIEKILINKNT